MTLPTRPRSTPMSFGRRSLYLAAVLCLAQSGACLASNGDAPSSAEKHSQHPTALPAKSDLRALDITVLARNDEDRSYCLGFAEAVTEVVSSAVTSSPGKGLMLIGGKQDAHPVEVFRKCEALAKAGKLDPSIASRVPELSEAIARWKDSLGQKPRKIQIQGQDLDAEKLQAALPFPLEGLGAELYLFAWNVAFDEAILERGLCALRASDLKRKNALKQADWAFYLPAKDSFEKVIDDLLEREMKKEDAGIVVRMIVNGAMKTARPHICRAVETDRQTMLFTTVVQARTQFPKEAIQSLAEAFTSPIKAGNDEQDTQERTALVEALEAKMSELKLTPSRP